MKNGSRIEIAIDHAAEHRPGDATEQEAALPEAHARGRAAAFGTMRTSRLSALIENIAEPTPPIPRSAISSE